MVRLPRGKYLYHTGQQLLDAYWLNSGMVSLVATSQDGSSVEVGMVGSEGCVGALALLGLTVMPYEMNVQIEVETAWRINVAALREEFNRGGKLQELLLQYMQVVLSQIVQSALCNRFHTVEQRLGRWLLLARDRVNSDTFLLTHEAIAQMLGTPRTGVTMIARHLQKEGLISYSRGRIIILDPKGIESVACECYSMTKESLFGFTQQRFRAA
ncbi:MAG TPA: Crp/Fnr family transcriptional regulator [Pyrinomonadaceae bacterium]